MRIGVLTFHNAINYGAILQTYATQHYLEAMGHEVTIIDYRNQSIEDAYLPYTFSLLRLFHRKPWNILPYLLTTLSYSKKRKKQYEFSKSELSLSHRQYFVGDALEQFDIILIGSDQVWNPNFTGGFDTFYWGQFEHGNSKVVAWAASSKEKALNNSDRKVIEALLGNFTAISVREQELKAFLSPISSQQIHVLPDPTLLLTKTEWKKLCHPVKEKDYILVYAMENEQDAIRIVEKLARKKNKKIIIINPYSHVRIQKGYKTTLSPYDFLSYFMYADEIMSVSFHGTAFSLIFEKQFYCYIAKGKSNVRIESILKQIGLESRIINEDTNLDELSVIDFNGINGQLEKLRKTAFFFFQSIK